MQSSSECALRAFFGARCNSNQPKCAISTFSCRRYCPFERRYLAFLKALFAVIGFWAISWASKSGKVGSQPTVLLFIGHPIGSLVFATTGALVVCVLAPVQIGPSFEQCLLMDAAAAYPEQTIVWTCLSALPVLLQCAVCMPGIILDRTQAATCYLLSSKVFLIATMDSRGCPFEQGLSLNYYGHHSRFDLLSARHLAFGQGFFCCIEVSGLGPAAASRNVAC